MAVGDTATNRQYLLMLLLAGDGDPEGHRSAGVKMHTSRQAAQLRVSNRFLPRTTETQSNQLYMTTDYHRGLNSTY